MRTSTAAKLVQLAHDITGVYVGTTDDGCFIDFGQGDERIRVELPVDGAIDIAASIIVSCVRAAVKRKGYTLQSYFGAIDDKIQQRLREVAGKKGDAS